MGSALVAHPLVKGVGFTGSFKGGKALYDLAQKRSEPIPVFAEMGSVNPMFILENKLKTDGTLAADLASSITLGTGQFCTNPGLIVLCDPENKSDFIDQIRKEINEIPLPPMVHANIEENYHEHLATLESINEGVKLHTSNNSHAAIGVVSASHFKMNPSLSEEVFGPFSMIVCCQTLDEMIKIGRAHV